MSWNWKPANLTDCEPGENISDNNSTTDLTDNCTIRSSEVERTEERMEVSMPSWTDISEDSDSWTEIEEDEFELDATSIEKVADKVWATDEAIVCWLWYLANHWEKAISDWDGSYIMAPNDSVKLDALKTLSKMKWHFETKRKKQFTNKKIKYVLVRDTKNPL